MNILVVKMKSLLKKSENYLTALHNEAIKIRDRGFSSHNCKSTACICKPKSAFPTLKILHTTFANYHLVCWITRVSVLDDANV